MKKFLSENFSVILLIIGFLFIIVNPILFFWNEPLYDDVTINSEKFGQFGDFFGGVAGSIWSLAGIILFYIALREQREDFKTNNKVLQAQTDALEMQIKEFELQRDELKETREVFQTQNKTIKTQQFESTFFSLVNLHHQIVNGISHSVQRNKYTGSRHKLSDSEKQEKIQVEYNGREVFELYQKYFMDIYSYKKVNESYTDNNLLLKDSYEEFFSRFHSHLGHYFRNLYHLFKFVHNADVENKKQYTSLIRAQLSNPELFLLYYNGMSPYGNKFLPLMKEYDILKNLNKPDFISINNHPNIY